LNSPQVSSDQSASIESGNKKSADVPKKASWNEKLKKILVEVLLDLHETGNFTDNSYKKDDWHKIIKEFNERSGMNYSEQQITSYLSSLKTDWQIYK
jgi:uncharacterized protein YxjI